MSDEDILSQDEMDALTDKGEGGKLKEELYDGGSLVAYDFKQPEHTKQVHFPTLQIINEKTALDLREKLEFMLQQKIEVNAHEVLINKYGDFVNSLDIPIDIKRINVPQLKGSFLVCFDENLLNAIIEEYFGAPVDLPSQSVKEENASNEKVEDGEEENKEDESKAEEESEEEVKEKVIEKEEFTNAESRISQKLLNYLLESMQSGWKILDNYSFEHSQSENNPRLINYLDYEELIININFEIELREKRSLVKIGMPYKMLDKVKHRLRRVVQDNNKSSDKKWLLKLYEKLQVVPMELVGELSKVTLPVSKLVELKAGDTVSFPKPENVTVYVNKTPVMMGNIGEVNGQTAIQISNWIKPNKATTKAQ